jgi:beta-N-acetylhexosaminidase
MSHPLGAVMLDVAGTSLTADERELLRHPQVGGVILFARNYESPEQLKALTADIRRAREPQLLIAVDHEGGRVQRFQAGFTRIPPMADIGHLPRGQARRAAQAAGTVIAAELSSHGVDFSFAPVLDVDFGSSSIIGNRAFSSEPARVAELAEAFHIGLKRGGSASVGKHFPGHGFVAADSHLAVPVDERGYADIERADLLPYATLIPAGLDGIMPAHVIYPKVDPSPAGFSAKWLKEILRGRLGFQGLIFSDDLSMEGASVAGGFVERANAALSAGCDMVLVCNDPAAAGKLVEQLQAGPLPVVRAERMRAKRVPEAEARHRAALESLQSAMA